MYIRSFGNCRFAAILRGVCLGWMMEGEVPARRLLVVAKHRICRQAGRFIAGSRFKGRRGEGKSGGKRVFPADYARHVLLIRRTPASPQNTGQESAPSLPGIGASLDLLNPLVPTMEKGVLVPTPPQSTKKGCLPHGIQAVDLTDS
jgi:hypothetical protein